MKKILAIALLAALFSIVSCQKEIIEPTIELTNHTTSTESNNPVTNNILPAFPSTTKNSLTVNMPSDLSLLQYLKGESNCSIFYEALIRTGIEVDLSGSGPFTVFVPNNEAFQTFFANNNWNSLDDISQNTLTKIVKYHVANIQVKIAELETGIVVPLFLTGKELYINTDDLNNPFVVLGLTSGKLIERDLEQKNGVVQKIDGVLTL